MAWRTRESRSEALPSRLTVIVCAWNEESTVAACLHSVLAQTRPADEIILVDNGSTDRTREIAAAIPGITVVDEARKGLTRARAAGARASTGDVIAWLDADCRAPLRWLERIEARMARPGVVAVTGPFRYYDWHRSGRMLLGLYDLVAAPAANVVVRDVLGRGALLYGGNFAVRRDTLARIGGIDTSIEFHGEDTNLGRRLLSCGRVVLARDCVMHTSARRYAALGTLAVLTLYARNYWSEVIRHRPADVQHLDVRA